MSESNFTRVNADGSLEVSYSANIGSAVREAIELAISTQKPQTFEFNGPIVTVDASSNAELIIRDWRRALNHYIDRHVGPTAKPTLTDEDLASDAAAEARNEDRRNADYALRQRQFLEQKDRVNARLLVAPAMEFSDRAGWLTVVAANQNDALGTETVRYAERWARLMQLELSEGKTLAEVWDSASHDADFGAMSGSTHGAARNILIKTWVHGTELQQLHRASE
jgi:hypothetical protein